MEPLGKSFARMSLYVEDETCKRDYGKETPRGSNGLGNMLSRIGSTRLFESLGLEIKLERMGGNERIKARK